MTLVKIVVGNPPKLTKITQDQLRELAEMTEYNDHSGALVLASEILDDGAERPSSLTIKLRTFQFMHNQQGSISATQASVRYALSQEVFEKAKIDFDPETYKQFYKCF